MASILDGTCFYVCKWNDRHETAASRKYARLHWTSMPIILNSKIFRFLTAQEDGESLLGIWYGLVMVAAQAPRDLRGYLADETGPLDVEDIALLTGFAAEKITRAIEIFSGPKIQWLKKVPWPLASEANHPGVVAEEPSGVGGYPTVAEDSPGAMADSATIAGDSPTTVGDPPPALPHPRSLPDRTEPDPTGHNPDRTEPVPDRTRAKPKPNRTGTRPNPDRTGPKPDRTKTQPNPTPTKPDQTQTGPNPNRTKPTGGVGGPGGGPGPGRSLRDQLPTPEDQALVRAGDDRFRQVFITHLAEAFGLNGNRLDAQFRSFNAVATRLQKFPNRKESAEKLVKLAKEKRDAGLSNPMSAWQSEVNKHYPPPDRPPRRRSGTTVVKTRHK